ncbi:MAG: hypothetical protein AB7O24_08745 [Kofleriaceae bacterium]
MLIAIRSRAVNDRRTQASVSASAASSSAIRFAMRLAGRLDWAALLRRVLGDDVTRCPRCGDHLRVLAFLTDPAVSARILGHLGLRTELPPLAPARAPPGTQPDLDIGC